MNIDMPYIKASQFILKQTRGDAMKTEYYYGMKLRGFSPGCQPREGLLGREYPNHSEWHDVLVYDRKLTKEEVSRYELEFIATVIPKED